MEETKNITMDAKTTGLETKAPSKLVNSSSDLMAVEPQTSTSLHRQAENRPLDGKGKQHFLQVPSLNEEPPYQIILDEPQVARL